MGTFEYRGTQFYLDGEPFTVLSGAMHYWRILPEYWEDRLGKLAACGFNTVETYIAWNLHEREEGKFDFSGRLDVVRFIEIAEGLGLKVIIRPGPYICAEFEFGGLPSWLLAYPNIRLRCNDERYLSKVRPYYRELISRIAPHQYTRGGGVIMVQIENEYGSYGDDKVYLQRIVDLYREYGLDCMLFTSDGYSNVRLSGGTLDDHLSVINFGSKPDIAFDALAAFKPNQPSMCGEFWCGWFDHWGEVHHTRTAEDTLRDMRAMLARGASLNFYMFHGGTNFGFTNGANHTDTEYLPTVTSYDYCAPLSEAGDLTDTYFAVREVLAEFNGGYCNIPVENTPKKAYGRCVLQESADLFENLHIGRVTEHAAPLSMEEVGQDFGYILYSTVLEGPFEEQLLVLDEVRDRALVYLGGQYAGCVERTGRQDEIKISLGKGERVSLDILVENCGRINYGVQLFDKKGILGGVRLGVRHHFGWRMTSLTMDDLAGIAYQSGAAYSGHPTFLRGTVEIPDEPCDTFLRLDGFKKGFAVINGFNLGRYWNEKGPQKTLYVPAPILKKGKNEIVVFESDGFANPEIEFVDKPDLG